jgi:5-methylcytosine-specific restriction endonuclease McrA
MTRDFDTPEYKAWRKKVYGRDRYRCQMPGCCTPTTNCKLEAHHIRRWADAPQLRYVLSNGITLCERCHELVNGREDEYAPTFMAIVGKKRNYRGVPMSISTLSLQALISSRKKSAGDKT